MYLEHGLTKKESLKWAQDWIKENASTSEGFHRETYETKGKKSTLTLEVMITPQGDMAGVCENEKRYSVVSVPQAENTPTFPFQGSAAVELLKAVTFGAYPFKPLREITPQEAQTVEGAQTVLSHFGQPVGKSLSDERHYFRGLPIQFYEAAVGREIAPEGYEKALCEVAEKETGKKLTAQERKSIVADPFLFNQATYFLAYCLYELQRTDSYTHLQEVLSQYPAFRLPAEWWKIEEEGDCFIASYLEDKSPEEWCVCGYVWGAFHGTNSLTEIKDYTGIPLPLLIGMADRERTINMMVQV